MATEGDWKTGMRNAHCPRQNKRNTKDHIRGTPFRTPFSSLSAVLSATRQGRRHEAIAMAFQVLLYQVFLSFVSSGYFFQKNRKRLRHNTYHDSHKISNAIPREMIHSNRSILLIFLFIFLNSVIR